jgi:SAM-dependent methyltransferase
MQSDDAQVLEKPVTRDDRSRQTAWERSYVRAGPPGLWPVAPVPFASRISGPLDRLLDCPVGDGKNAPVLLGACRMFVGCDTSRSALAKTERRLSGATKQPYVLLKADAHDMPFLDDYFDAVFCCDLLGHLPDAKQVLRELLRMLAPGGRIVFNVFSTADSVQTDPRMKVVGPRTSIYMDEFYFHFYDERETYNLIDGLPITKPELEHVTWIEPPHPGYREYEHEHASWVVVGSKA